MQIFIFKNRLLLLLLITTVLYSCGQGEVETPKPVVQPEPILYGTVGGKVTDAETNNPIPGAVVKLFGLAVKTEVDGIFVFRGIPYIDEQNLTVHDPDYQVYTHTFMLNEARLTVNAALIPLRNSTDELNAYLENFSDLLASLDMENLPVIEAHFSESYVASDDPVTTFGILSGIIPPNYEGVIPTFTNVFETYSWLEFVFRDTVMNITHARKASVELFLDIDSENAEDGNLRHLNARCNFEFRREGSDWKIVYWQLVTLDIHM